MKGRRRSLKRADRAKNAILAVDEIKDEENAVRSIRTDSD